jgi:hypothetical protein
MDSSSVIGTPASSASISPCSFPPELLFHKTGPYVEIVGYSVVAFIGNSAVPEFMLLTIVLIGADNLPTRVMHCCAS